MGTNMIFQSFSNIFVTNDADRLNFHMHSLSSKTFAFRFRIVAADRNKTLAISANLQLKLFLTGKTFCTDYLRFLGYQLIHFENDTSIKRNTSLEVDQYGFGRYLKTIHRYRLFQFYRYHQHRYRYFSMTDTDNQPIPIYLDLTDNRYRYRYLKKYQYFIGPIPILF